MGIPLSMLPEIRSSSEVYGEVASPACSRRPDRRHPRRPAGGDVRPGLLRGRQGQEHLRHRQLHAAQHGHGAGAVEERPADHGLLQDRRRKPIYALEGSIAVTGSLVQWLRDNLGMISTAPEIEELARTVDDNGGAYFVPAFSGLFAPYWRSDARGALVGLTRLRQQGPHRPRGAGGHGVPDPRGAGRDERRLRRAADELKVDGGMVVNEMLMQFQADILGVAVIRPKVAETTALGAAYAAGLAVGFWESEDDIRDNWAEDKRWEPQMDDAERDAEYRNWKKAVTKTFDWVE